MLKEVSQTNDIIDFIFQGHNLFANISSEDYSDIINLLKEAILATDLSLHVQ